MQPSSVIFNHFSIILNIACLHLEVNITMRVNFIAMFVEQQEIKRIFGTICTLAWTRTGCNEVVLNVCTLETRWVTTEMILNLRVTLIHFCRYQLDSVSLSVWFLPHFLQWKYLNYSSRQHETSTRKFA